MPRRGGSRSGGGPERKQKSPPSKSWPDVDRCATAATARWRRYCLRRARARAGQAEQAGPARAAQWGMGRAAARALRSAAPPPVGVVVPADAGALVPADQGREFDEQLALEAQRRLDSLAHPLARSDQRQQQSRLGGNDVVDGGRPHAGPVAYQLAAAVDEVELAHGGLVEHPVQHAARDGSCHRCWATIAVRRAWVMLRGRDGSCHCELWPGAVMLRGRACGVCAGARAIQGARIGSSSLVGAGAFSFALRKAGGPRAAIKKLTPCVCSLAQSSGARSASQAQRHAIARANRACQSRAVQMEGRLGILLQDCTITLFN